jgi:hypothetical protein
MLVFLTSRCVDCGKADLRREMRWLADLERQYRTAGLSIAILTDEAILSLLQREKIPLPSALTVARDDGVIHRQYGLAGSAGCVLMNPQSTLLWKQESLPSRGAELLIPFLNKELMNGKKADSQWSMVSG